MHVIGGGSPAAASCAPAIACTLTPYFPDQTVDGDRVSANPNLLSEGSSLTQAPIFNYSTQLGPGQGRALATGGSGPSGTNIDRVADFRFQVPSGQNRSYVGNAMAALWVACPSGAAVTFHVYVGTSTNNNMNNFTSSATATGASVVACTGAWQEARTQVPIATTLANKLSTSKYLTVRVTATAAASITTRLLYDSTANPAAITMPRTS